MFFSIQIGRKYNTQKWELLKYIMDVSKEILVYVLLEANLTTNLFICYMFMKRLKIVYNKLKQRTRDR